MKNNKGITLIALVITIIVMLILVGVTVSAAINENYLIQRKKRQKIQKKQNKKNLIIWKMLKIKLMKF